MTHHEAWHPIIRKRASFYESLSLLVKVLSRRRTTSSTWCSPTCFSSLWKNIVSQRVCWPLYSFMYIPISKQIREREKWSAFLNAPLLRSVVVVNSQVSTWYWNYAQLNFTNVPLSTISQWKSLANPNTTSFRNRNENLTTISSSERNDLQEWKLCWNSNVPARDQSRLAY